MYLPKILVLTKLSKSVDFKKCSSYEVGSLVCKSLRELSDAGHKVP